MLAASPDRQAASSLGLLALIATSVFSLSVFGIALGFQSLLISTNTAMDAVKCCGTIFSSCLLSPSLARATLPWIAMLILLYGVVLAIWRGAFHVCRESAFTASLGQTASARHEKLDAQVRRLGLEGEVFLIPEVESHRAFTVGISRPKIYIDQGACEALEADELAAVLAHEDHHRRRGDPFRSLLILFLNDLLYFLPLGAALTQLFNTAREEAADDAAVAQEGEALGLASALCRLARLQAAASEEITIRATGKGPIQQRVERLLKADKAKPRRPGIFKLTMSVILIGLLVGTLLLPLFVGESPFVFQGCSPETCRSMGCM